MRKNNRKMYCISVRSEQNAPDVVSVEYPVHERMFAMRKISNLFIVMMLVLSHFMCIIVAYHYRDMLCAVEHSAASAPASVAFLYTIPFAAGILLCGIFAYIFRKK